MRHREAEKQTGKELKSVARGPTADGRMPEIHDPRWKQRVQDDAIREVGSLRTLGRPLFGNARA